MEVAELSRILARGEDSQQQFKRNVTNTDSLAEELVAFSNSGGGHLIIGVGDQGDVTGLDSADIARLNQLLSNTASQNVNPPINPSSPSPPVMRRLTSRLTVVTIKCTTPPPVASQKQPSGRA